ncbi:MAG: homocysteine S-methyltransferase family protein [Clostridia bacterium]|nr:homocysteine S-methyltransferase family protein [Clostridia bacterium]
MKKDIRELIREKRIFLDGGTGTVLQSMGLSVGVAPESWNLTNPEKVEALHRAYFEAGSNIVCTNTFGVNSMKYENYEEYIAAAISAAKAATDGKDDRYVAFDMGPTGKLLSPLGDLSFERAVEIFSDNARLAKKYGADLVLIETMNDSYETKAALLAVKECTDLPVFVTNVYDATMKTMTGSSPEAMIALLEGMGADAVGMNCSLGPDKMIPIMERFSLYSSLPVIVKPNAGLPVTRNGVTGYDIDAVGFAGYMEKLCRMGASIVGGCCGTTPEYIRKTAERVKDIPFVCPEKKNKTLISSYTHTVTVGDDPVLIGERINPTGKKKVKEALRENDLSYLLSEAVGQAEKGAHILDVNVGLPDIDEAAMMVSCVKEIQAVTDLPLQIDTTNKEALGAALRIYNGKALINSVNGEEESMKKVFPLAKKYGGAVIALTMDENGIPETAEERVAVAEKIIAAAKEYGIDKKEIIVDPLALTVSSNKDSAKITLETIKRLRKKGIYTSLGVSNISFGLPERDKINSAFFTEALKCGLNMAIMNPYSDAMMDSYHAFRVLEGLDEGCRDYIAYANSAKKPEIATVQKEITLRGAIASGMVKEAGEVAEKLLSDTAPTAVIDEHIIPALSEVGRAFEEGRAFLPQLLMSAESATRAFDAVKEKLPKGSAEKGSVILATVKGDIHDIGKNIVKVLLESYGFKVIDLGRDVAPEKVLEKAKATGCRLIGLSALMTTTVPAMEETIALIHRELPEAKVIVGGAVLTPEYAESIKADKYCKDAMEAVAYAKEFYREERS